MLSACARPQARRIRAAGWMGRNRSRESSVGARRALLDAPAAEEPLCPSSPRSQSQRLVPWAVRAQVRPEVIAFLRFKPVLLHDSDAMSDENAWPTPRSWEMPSTVLNGISRRQASLSTDGGE